MHYNWLRQTAWLKLASNSVFMGCMVHWRTRPKTLERARNRRNSPNPVGRSCCLCSDSSELGPPGVPMYFLIYLRRHLDTMAKGSQKEARLRRLREEILNYVTGNPGCTASQIVAWLSIDLKMKNHGLTPRKVGFFIPRYCKELVWKQDSMTGKRIYTNKGWTVWVKTQCPVDRPLDP